MRNPPDVGTLEQLIPLAVIAEIIEQDEYSLDVVVAWDGAWAVYESS